MKALEVDSKALEMDSKALEFQEVAKEVVVKEAAEEDFSKIHLKEQSELKSNLHNFNELLDQP